MKRYIYLIAWCLFAVAFLPGYSAHSITVADAKTWSWWGYNGEQNATGTSAGFILDGVLQKYGSKDCNNGPCGTYPGDEGAVVGLIAEKIYENGAQFCPYQMQCNNKDKEKYSYTNYYYPMCSSNRQCTANDCITLCKSGYTGDGCTQRVSGATTKDTTDYSTKFNNIKLKTSGGKDGEREKYVLGFKQWGKDPEHDVVLGVVKYLKHGVIARPVQFDCHRKDYKVARSYVDNVAETGTKKLLCAAGYTANAAETDCVTNWCTGYTENQFNSTQHTEFSDGTCSKFKCKDSSKGFADTAKRDCVKCDNGIADDGTCKPAPKAEPVPDALIPEPQTEPAQETQTAPASKPKFCPGFPATDFDASIHESLSENGCIKYFCKDNDMAFTKSGDYTCDVCNTDAKTGIDSNGVCVKCNTGDIFKGNTCVSTEPMEKNYLLYGPTKTNGGQKWNENWCWTKMDPDEYATCVKNKQ
ncbi:MAG: hypothetical protein MJ187_01260 [Alphaproteobacteria bacterium]|nr:hypothetical protein [Alphaproteobacteria bacterium]